ncbi:hypothetical protein PR048_009294 [Dryococelus australis]|uniref:Uncharacterized protein n=1 Tax=Dryococelus australis TaxID=614101 RepID=A0ABQ9I079_9NEOP|nr:hypothetical protein PR048_009294 [Dryococelus australis]
MKLLQTDFLFIRVVADGSWSKRCYRANFSSLSGSRSSSLSAHLSPRDPDSIPGDVRPWIFAYGKRTRRCHWPAGFLGDLPFPTPLHSGTAPFTPHLVHSSGWLEREVCSSSKDSWLLLALSYHRIRNPALGGNNRMVPVTWPAQDLDYSTPFSLTTLSELSSAPDADLTS